MRNLKQITEIDWEAEHFNRCGYLAYHKVLDHSQLQTRDRLITVIRWRRVNMDTMRFFQDCALDRCGEAHNEQP